jgi:hypothetical protein
MAPDEMSDDLIRRVNCVDVDEAPLDNRRRAPDEQM